MKFIVVEVDDSKAGMWLVYDDAPILIKWFDVKDVDYEWEKIYHLGHSAERYSKMWYDWWVKIVADTVGEKFGGKVEASPVPSKPHPPYDLIGRSVGYQGPEGYVLWNNEKIVEVETDPTVYVNYPNVPAKNSEKSV